MKVKVYIVEESQEEGGGYSAIAPRINWAAAYGNTIDEALNRLGEVIPLMLEALLEGYDSQDYLVENAIDIRELDYRVA